MFKITKLDEVMAFTEFMGTVPDSVLVKIGVPILSNPNGSADDNDFNHFLTDYNKNNSTTIDSMQGSIITLTEISKRWLEEKLNNT